MEKSGQRLTPQFANSRKIAERIVVEGWLKLTTPARFGGGGESDLLDMPLLLDEAEKCALLTGASIAGALRNYLRAKEFGDNRKESKDALCVALFGRAQAEAEGNHSVLMTHDAYGESKGALRTELRDGVAIDPRTRTAMDGKKFDIELLEAGERFQLRFEVLLPEDPSAKERILLALAVALQGLEKGEIGLGARKRRGFGQCQLDGDWTVIRYATRNNPAQLAAWLKKDRAGAKTGQDIASLLDAPTAGLPDKRQRFVISAEFKLNGSLIIRSGNGDVNAADAAHLHSRRGASDVPVLSGTSLAGALRGRALRIANTLAGGRSEKGWAMVNDIFGVRPTEQQEKSGEKIKLTASRLITHEAEIQHAATPDLVQTRVKIDRFTGGAYPTGLFSEQPVFSTGQTCFTMKLELLNAKEHEAGLLMLLLKDLWTGDLPLGGESSVGRGRLTGVKAEITFGTQDWHIAGENNLTITGDRPTLERFVTAFTQEMEK